jgi:hypothetical protein
LCNFELIRYRRFGNELLLLLLSHMKGLLQFIRLQCWVEFQRRLPANRSTHAICPGKHRVSKS